MRKIILIISLFFQICSCERLSLRDKSVTEELSKFDEVLFPYLLTSYMWHIPALSTDEMDDSSFEWLRFRSAVGEKFSEATDYCIGIKKSEQKIEIQFLKVHLGQTCAGEGNQILSSVKNLKRAIWNWPKNLRADVDKSIQIDFEWIENNQWKKLNLKYDLPYFPINHESISWGKTWRNQKPFKELDWVNPTSSIFLKSKSNILVNKVVLANIAHTDPPDWQKARVCFAVDDQCQPLMAEMCHLCEKSFFTLYNTKCKTQGTSYCGEINCGQRNQPACYLGQHHIKQDDFKGCSPFTEEWYCHQGLEIKCGKDGPVCY